MLVLGINAYHGDVAAALLRDGQLVAALEEERFRRIKHVAGFPRAAVHACLGEAGIAASDVDHIAISRNPQANRPRKVAFAVTSRPDPALVRQRLRNRQTVAITQYLGFTKYGDEYKVMGLAPYGEPRYVNELRELVHPSANGAFALDLTYFRHWFEGVSMTWEDGEPVLGTVYTTPSWRRFWARHAGRTNRLRPDTRRLPPRSSRCSKRPRSTSSTPSTSASACGASAWRAAAP